MMDGKSLIDFTFTADLYKHGRRTAECSVTLTPAVADQWVEHKWLVAPCVAKAKAGLAAISGRLGS